MMTRDEILAMQAGREMDALVAEKVMGFAKPIYVHPPELHHEVGARILVNGWYCRPNYEHGDVCEWHPVHYSTDISAAWEVVEKMIADGWWNTNIGFGGGIVVSFDDGSKTVEARADTAPLTICRAALLAVMEDKR